MAFIQENVIHIHLNLNTTYTLIHFSDVHAIHISIKDSSKEYQKALEHETSWLRVRKEFADYFNELCTEEHMIASCQCLKNLLYYTNQIQPDLLLMSGDIIDYNSSSNIQFLTKEVKKLTCPYIITYGNHENPDIFKKITYNQDDFMVQNLKELKVIGIDNSKKVFTSNQIQKLKKELEENKPILLCMHIPLMTSLNQNEMKKYDTYYIIDHQNCDKVTKEFIDLVISHPLIKHIFCGHTHGQGLSEFAKNKNQYCASSGLIGYVNKIILS